MSSEFGGLWTHIKLDVLEQYLNSYVNVFKKQDWCHLIYIDAFAGSGECNTNIGLTDGSARRALNVDRFDEYVFIEFEKENIDYLERLKAEYPSKNIKVMHGDSNNEMIKIVSKYDWKKTRALSFLDPFSMELSFDTLRLLANTNAVDIWYLFPFGDTTRALRKDGEIAAFNEKRLNILFGEKDWKNNLYYENPQINFLEDKSLLRKEQKEICCYFKHRLETIFASVSCPICLKNSNNTPLFLLYFAVANKKAVFVANKIANHIISKEQTFVCNDPRK